MAIFIVCKVCGEMNSTSFSYCWKCGAELHVFNSSQEASLPPIIQEKTDEYLEKVCIIGSPEEVRHEWIRRFAEGKFPTNSPSYMYPISGVDITTKQIQVDSNNVKLILTNIAGQEIFSKLRPNYYRGASAAIITFDKSDKDTFKAAKDYYEEFRKYISHPSVPVALVGFVTESEEVTTVEGQNLADELNASYYELTPTDTKITEKILHDLTKKIL